jgi:hypothetical protein
MNTANINDVYAYISKNKITSRDEYRNAAKNNNVIRINKVDKVVPSDPAKYFGVKWSFIVGHLVVSLAELKDFVANDELVSDSRSYRSEFRVPTWTEAGRIIPANPLTTYGITWYDLFNKKKIAGTASIEDVNEYIAELQITDKSLYRNTRDVTQYTLAGSIVPKDPIRKFGKNNVRWYEA